MNKRKYLKGILYFVLSVAFVLTGVHFGKAEVAAATFPAITVEFDAIQQTVIVSGVPEKDESGNTNYMLRGYLNYGNERVETFSYAPSVYPYHVPEKQAYIFEWKDSEFLLPCSGEYQFTAYLVCGSMNGEEAGPKTTITITLTKVDESTNWGPGLPNTTVESYDLGQIKGKDKNIVIEEEGYTWTINGQNITNVPDKNISLAIAVDPENFQMQGVDEFFGETIASKFSIEHNGEFGFLAILDYLVGTQYSGKHANLFYVVGDGTFQFMEGAVVDESGKVKYNFNHASDYIVAITDVEYSGQELKPKATEPPIETATPEPVRTATPTPAVTPEPQQEVTATTQPVQDMTDVNATAVPAATPQPEAAQESSNVVLFVVIGCIAVAAMIVVVLLGKKRKK